MKSFVLILLFLACPAFAQYDDLANTALSQWKVPGIAIAIVQNDKVIYLKGIGVKEAGKADPVTPDTLFEIGSTTKAFTTTAMAMLVDEKKMSWDDPVRKHLDYFHLSDPCADSLVTLRDIVSHRSGLSRHDELWDYDPTMTREQLIRAVATVKLTKPIRSAYQYNNIMFTTAGEAVAAAAKMPWDTFVRTRIFEPLGMTHTRTTFAEWPSTDHATGHRYDSKTGAMIPHVFENDDSIGPAGTIKTSARDMAQWLRFQLANGAIDGKRLVSAEALQETKSPQTIIRMDESARENAPETNILTYGLGWNVSDYRGELLVAHGGALNSFRSQVAMLPKLNAGVVLITNAGRGYSIIALRNAILDRLLNKGTRDWNRYYMDYEQRSDAKDLKAKLEREMKRPAGTHPSHDLASYAGSYENTAYGTATVTVENDALKLQWKRIAVPLTHAQYDTFRATDDAADVDETVQFGLNAEGDVKTLTLFGEEFTKK
jgi:CubicO group peptidase (beta-lactamase class C family)